MINKKKIAAIAAVADYIKSEQELFARLQSCALQESAKCLDVDGPVAPAVALNVWGAGGRQQQMQMRCLMQMKSFHRSKPMA